MSTTDLEQTNSNTKRTLIEDGDDGTDRVYSKRRRISNDELGGDWWRKPAEIKLSHDDYTVGWIYALPIELAASHAMLDKVHKSLPTVDNDTDAYILGSIGGHNIAMACLPSGQYETNNAATVTGNMMRSFESIRFGFMVGIGGGVPGEIDIRLGDIVVGTSVVQHDLGKIVEGTGFQGTGTPRIPPQLLLNAVSKLRALHEVKDSQVVVFLREMEERYPKLFEYALPSASEDRLFRVTKNHDHGHSGGCCSCSVVEVCDRISRNDERPRIHYGGIASGNQVIKCSQRRDELAKEHNVICFEMEAAGLSDALPSIVVRGICDYADSQKNKEWQKYAAATAAAYTKELISIMTPSEPIRSVQVQTSRMDQSPLELNSRREALLESLRFEQIDARQATIKEAHSRTCEWILNDSAYKQWHDLSHQSHHHGFLWISGKPGAGKSTIMKFAYSRARRSAKKNSAIVSFFFNARGDALEKSTLGLYRSLLLQLLEKFPDLQTVLDDPTLVVTRRLSCPTVDELQHLLRNSIAALGQRQLTCFVDALDECDEMQVRDMVVFFEDLGERAAARGVQLKTCFSSRHYPHIDIRHGLKMVLEYQPGHGQDLETYVKSYLRAGNNEYVDGIRSTILTKAGGVFMWVVLVVQLLNAEFVRGRRAQVEQRLQEIPAGLSNLFRDILRRDNANMDDLLLCIQWVLFARRPLTLKEFYFAMLSGLPELQDQPRVHDSDYDSDENMRLFVTGSSKGLAEITKSTTGTVQFIHESVKDFLIKDNGLRELWPQLGDNFEISSHEKLKFCCLSHITDEVTSQLEAPSIEDLPKANSREAKRIRQRCEKRFPFLTYASQNLLYHANLVAAKSSVDTLWILPLRHWIHLANIFEKHQSRRYLSTASLTYILAEKDVSNILREHISRFPTCDIKGERYGFPLFAALANKSWAAANVLLGPAAAAFSEKEPLFPFENYRKHFASMRVQDSHPLHWAISTGHDKVAEFIISSELYECFLLDSGKRYPLHWAAVAGNGARMKQLLEKLLSPNHHVEGPVFSRASAVPKLVEHKDTLERASVHTYLNLPDSSDDTVLSLACKHLREDAVRVLMEFGADFSQASARIAFVEDAHTRLNKWLAEFILEKGLLASEKLLDIAILNYVHDVAKLVMDSEDFVHKVGNFDGAEILARASNRGNTAILKSLLERGVTFSNCRWATRPLREAALAGDETFIKLLLKSGVQLCELSFQGESPLIAAAYHGHAAVVDMLLGKDALAYDEGDLRESLHEASSRGHEAVVESLLKHNARVKLIAGLVDSLLLSASAAGNAGVVKVLLKYGADINHRRGDGATPLHLASWKGHPNVVKILVRNGAFLEARDHECRTPLHNAAWGKEEEVARILLAGGANARLRDRSNQTPSAVVDLAEYPTGHATKHDALRQILRDAVAKGPIPLPDRHISPEDDVDSKVSNISSRTNLHGTQPMVMSCQSPPRPTPPQEQPGYIIIDDNESFEPTEGESKTLELVEIKDYIIIDDSDSFDSAPEESKALEMIEIESTDDEL